MDDPLLAALAKMLSAEDRETLSKGLALREAFGRLRDAAVPIAEIADDGDPDAIVAVETLRRELLPKFGALLAAGRYDAALKLCAEAERGFQRIKFRMAN